MFNTWNLSVITLSAYLDFPTPLSPTIKIFSVVRTSFSIVPRSTPLLQSVLIPQTFNLLLKSTEIFRYIFSFRHCYFLQETRLLLWRKTADIYTRGDEGPYGASTSILIKFSLIARLRLFGEHKQRKRINHVYYVYSFSLFVSSKRRFATTIAQHNVATSFRMVTTLFQHCRVFGLKIVVANRPVWHHPSEPGLLYRKFWHGSGENGTCPHRSPKKGSAGIKFAM